MHIPTFLPHDIDHNGKKSICISVKIDKLGTSSLLTLLTSLSRNAQVHFSCVDFCILPCREVPCLSLCFWNGILIGGFANGLVKLYDACSGAKLVEVAAHARCINALDLAPEAGLVSMCSVCIN